MLLCLFCILCLIPSKTQRWQGSERSSGRGEATPLLNSLEGKHEVMTEGTSLFCELYNFKVDDVSCKLFSIVTTMTQGPMKGTDARTHGIYVSLAVLGLTL